MNDYKEIEETVDPLQEVLSTYKLTLKQLRFQSLTGDKLRVAREPIIRIVKGARGSYEEVKRRDAFRFEAGFYPPPGRRITEDEARELITSPFCKDNPNGCDRPLFKIMPPPPPPPKPIDQQIEERAQELAEQRAREIAERMLLERTARRGRTDSGEEDEPGVPEEEDVEIAAAPRTVISGVTSKLEAIEALAGNGVDVGFASNLSKTPVAKILEVARQHGIRFEGWGE